MKIQLILCEISEFEKKPMKRFMIGDQPVLVIRKNDEFYAIQDRCSHAGASLAAGKLIDYEIECPMHGARFDIRSGEVKSLPAAVPLEVYNVLVENGQIILEMELEGSDCGGCSGEGCGGNECACDVSKCKCEDADYDEPHEARPVLPAKKTKNG